MKSRWLIPALAASALLLGACGNSATQTTDGPTLYQQHCAACHGSAGAGATGPAIPDPAVAYTVEGLTDIIRVGVGTMPGTPALSDTQVESLVEYLRTDF